jgi:hypothetical protein
MNGKVRCNGCGLLVTNWHKDHIHPRCRSGTDDPENHQILCAFCNLSKGALTMREWCSISNTRGNLFWAGREDQVPRGRTRDPNEQRRADRFDTATAAKQLWDRDVNSADPSSVAENWPLLYQMTGEDARERIELINLFATIGMFGDRLSLQKIRKEAKRLTDGCGWDEWPPPNWMDDPRVKETTRQLLS